MANARVVPCVTRLLEGGSGYSVELGAPWAGFPGDNIEADTVRMNEFIERCVAGQAEQYFWLHKRFKTRPPGQASLYD